MNTVPSLVKLSAREPLTVTVKDALAIIGIGMCRSVLSVTMPSPASLVMWRLTAKPSTTRVSGFELPDARQHQPFASNRLFRHSVKGFSVPRLAIRDRAARGAVRRLRRASQPTMLAQDERPVEFNREWLVQVILISSHATEGSGSSAGSHLEASA